MGLANFLIGIILLLAGCYLLYFLLKQFIAPLIGGVSSSNRLFKYRKMSIRLEKVDQLIEEGKYKQAVKELKNAIVLRPQTKPELINKIKEHHQNVISRCLVLAEELQTEVSNIAEVEKLFLTRTELQHLLLKANDKYSKLKSKREMSGRALPKWSRNESEQKINDIKQEISKNLGFLEEALAQMFSDILNKKKKEDVVYH